MISMIDPFLNHWDEIESYSYTRVMVIGKVTVIKVLKLRLILDFPVIV